MEAAEQGLTVTEETKECRRVRLLTGWRWWVSLRETKAVSILHEIETFT